MGETITIDALDGSGNFSAYVAKPESGTGPAIIVIQEIFGVNAGLRQICDNYAAEGYIAISPDLFWRQEAGVELSDQTDEEWQKAFALYQGFDVDKGVDDIQATINAAIAMDGCTGRIGAVGYCLGGLLAYLTSCRTNAQACVSYYGVGIQDHLEEAGKIDTALMLHIAGEDEFVPKDAQEAIAQTLIRFGFPFPFVYEGADHAFSRINGKHYDEANATLANERTKDFFYSNLFLNPPQRQMYTV